MLAGTNAVDEKEKMRSPRNRVVSFSEIVERPSSVRIAIKRKKGILFIDAADIVSVEARGNYVVVHHKSNLYILREPISKVAEKLKIFGFVRIHRSFVVNSAFAEDLKPLSTGEYVLRVGGGKEYIVSRTYKNNLQFLASSWIGSTALGET